MNLNLADRRSSRRAADKATSKLLELYDSDGSEAGSEEDLPKFQQSQSAAGPVGPIPPPKRPSVGSSRGRDRRFGLIDRR